MQKLKHCLTTALVLMATISLVGCPLMSKTQIAKFTVGMVTLGTDTAKEVIARVIAEKKSQCGKLGVETSPEYVKCYAETKKMEDATNKLWPQLAEAQKLTLAALKAKEDPGKVLRHSVCLLTVLTTWLPENYKEKVETWISLASAYACDKSAATIVTPEQQRYALTTLNKLLLDLGANT
jgi:hypothetical protein